MKKEKGVAQGQIIHCIILDSGFWILDSYLSYAC